LRSRGEVQSLRQPDRRPIRAAGLNAPAIPTGARGKFVPWVSAGFWREYRAARAVKLAIIDAAFAAVSRRGARDAVASA